MKESQFTVVGIGELLWDEFPAGRQIGGAPANFAYHCQVRGASSFVVSSVGDDKPGRDLIDALVSRDLQTAHVFVDPDHPTGSVSVVLDSDGGPTYDIAENVAWDYIPQRTEPAALAEKANAVCFGTLAQRSLTSRETIRTFLNQTRPECLRLFDLNLRQQYYDRQLIEENLALANALKLNEEELRVLSEFFQLGPDYYHMLDELARDYELNVIALTLGERGCIIRTGEQTIQQDGIQQDSTIDTVGAGDCFSAVLTMGLLRREPLRKIAVDANRSAAFVCTQEGAMPEMP